jgi:hypothetical protein
MAHPHVFAMVLAGGEGNGQLRHPGAAADASRAALVRGLRGREGSLSTSTFVPHQRHLGDPDRRGVFVSEGAD